jgi:HK97 gp10 family phage protein
MSIWATATWTPRGDLGRFTDVVITPVALETVRQAGEMIQDAAKRLCPVATGRLRDSILVEVQQTEKTARAIIAPTMDYAGYVEFGTGIRGASSPGAGQGPYSPTWPGMPAQPYMRPAFDEQKEAIQDLFRANVSTAIRSPYA